MQRVRHCPMCRHDFASRKTEQTNIVLKPIVNKPAKLSPRSRAWVMWKTTYNLALKTIPYTAENHEMRQWHHTHPEPLRA